MWTNFSQLAQGLREQATAAVHNAGLDEQLVSMTLIALETLLLTTQQIPGRACAQHTVAQVHARSQVGSLASSVLTLEPGQQDAAQQSSAGAPALARQPSKPAQRSTRNTGDQGVQGSTW